MRKFSTAPNGNTSAPLTQEHMRLIALYDHNGYRVNLDDVYKSTPYEVWGFGWERPGDTWHIESVLTCPSDDNSTAECMYFRHSPSIIPMVSGYMFYQKQWS